MRTGHGTSSGGSGGYDESYPGGCFEVRVQIVPSNRDGGIGRDFILDRDHRDMPVGRASKDSTKGLSPSRNNAYFNHQIMSRQHAVLTANPGMKELYIEDLGSAHGTVVGGQRLEKSKRCIVKNGAVVEFGMKIFTGNNTYHALETRVYTDWMPLRKPDVEKAPVQKSPGAIIVPGPSDDEEDVEDLRDQSVQIIERAGCVRAYTVQSDSEKGSVSPGSEKEGKKDAALDTPPTRKKDTPVTSPENGPRCEPEEADHAEKARRDANLEQMKQMFKANKETKARQMTEQIDAARKANLKESEASASRSNAHPKTVAKSDAATTNDGSSQEYAIVLDSASNVVGFVDETGSAGQPARGKHTYFGDGEEDSDSQPEIMPIVSSKEPARKNDAHLGGKPTIRSFFNSHSMPQDNPPEGNLYSVSPQPGVNCGSGPALLPPLLVPGPFNATVRDEEFPLDTQEASLLNAVAYSDDLNEDDFVEDSPDVPDSYAVAAQASDSGAKRVRTSSPSDAAMANLEARRKSRLREMVMTDEELARMYPKYLQPGERIVMTGPSNVSAPDKPSQSKTESSSLKSVNAAASAAAVAPIAKRANPLIRPVLSANSFSSNSNDAVNSSPYATASEHSVTRAPAPLTKNKSTKVQISSLINAEAQPVKVTQKRKAAAISQDDEFASRFTTDSTSSMGPRVASSQESMTTMPDAQPRDVSQMTESFTLFNNSGSALPASYRPDSAPSARPVFTRDRQQPVAPRKRVKTSADTNSSWSSVGGIGMFMAGVGAGVLGLAATFLATIPASVQQEAMMEL